MIDWAYVAVPFLVLPIVLLFRFVGCGNFTGSDAAPGPATGANSTAPPDYDKYLMNVTPNPGPLKDASQVSKDDIIGYWRLVDDPSSPVAVDAKGFQNGTYVQGTEIAPQMPDANKLGGSEAAPGILVTGQPSLIDATTNDKKVMCRLFQGGYVIVPYKDGLYDGFAAGNFTIECWINVKWSQATKGYQHTLFFTGGHYQSPTEFAAQHNRLRVYADESNLWKVDVYPNPTPPHPDPLPVVLSTDVLVTFGATTHLVVTLKKNAQALIEVSLWINGQNTQSDMNRSPATIVDCASPLGAPLLIGVTNTSPVDPQLTPTTVVPTQPILSEIQEVVLYRRALSGPEILTHYRLNSPTGGY